MEDGNGTTVAIIALAVAAYGALLSTLNALRERRKDKPELTVRAFVRERPDGTFDVHVHATNTGHRRLIAEDVLFDRPQGEMGSRLEPAVGDYVPKTLDAGDSLNQMYFIYDENNPRSSSITVTDNYHNAWTTRIENWINTGDPDAL